MAIESNENACFLELPNGMGKGVRYLQKFVKAPSQGKGPCNYAAQKADANAEAMKASMGK